MSRLNRLPIVALLALAFTVACSEDPADPDDNGNGNGGPDPVVFVWTNPSTAPTVTSITVAGTFNEWNTTALPMAEQANGTWRATLALTPGVYEYKFVFNGDQWPVNMCNDATWGDPANGGRVDPQVVVCVDDEHGGLNAEITIAE